MAITIHRRLRPLWLGFLVPPDDAEVLLRVIQMNTCLWGGRFNPIIPLYRRAQWGWSEEELFRRDPSLRRRLSRTAKRSLIGSAREIVNGYLRAFEPDYVVETRPGLAARLNIKEDFVIKLDDVMPADATRIAYGLSVSNLYAWLYEREFRFVRRHPRKIVLPTITDQRLSLFGALCFGTFPANELGERIKREYIGTFDASAVAVDSSNLLEIPLTRQLTPLRVGSDGLEVRADPWHREPSLFLFDGTRARDLIDFWNLRAFGWPVLPVPEQWADALVEPCSRLVRATYQPIPGNPQGLMQHVELVVPKSTNPEQVEGFVQNISAPVDTSKPQLPSVLVAWYPRLWEKRRDEMSVAGRCEVSAEESDCEAQIEGDRLSFGTLTPAFARTPGSSSGPAWATVIQIRHYSRADETALVIPPGIADFERLIGALELRVASLSKEGIVIRCRYRDWKESWRLPTGLDVFVSWLRERGFEAKLSGAGRLTLELVHSLGGLWGLASVSNVEVLQLLNSMAVRGIEADLEDAETESHRPDTTRVRSRVVQHKKWFDLLKRVNENRSDVAKRWLERLTQCGVLKLGVRLRCDACAQTNWYPLEQLAERLRCERCLGEFQFPVTDPPIEACII